MCDRCAELEAEIEELRIQLLLKPRENRARVLAQHLRVTPAESRILILLYEARSLVSAEELEYAIANDHAKDYADTSNVVSVYLSKIRNKHGSDFFECTRGTGYRLSDRARALCKAIIDENPNLIEEALRAAPNKTYRLHEQVRWVDDPKLMDALERFDKMGLSLSQMAKEMKATRGQIAGAVYRHIRNDEAKSHD